LDLRLVTGSLATLGISPAGSRFAHARKPAQHVRALGFAFGHISEYSSSPVMRAIRTKS